MKMRRFILLLSAISLLLTISAFAQAPTVYVTVSSGSTLVAKAKPVTVTDADGDGALTINDALLLAHEKSEDYGYAVTEYGLSLTKLWGIENESGYGYYLNNGMTYSLADEIKDKDEVYAFVYEDAVGFSDVFCFFDSSRIQALAGEDVTLTLMQGAFDENWNYSPIPLANASIIVNGEKSDITTDENGKFTISFDEEGIRELSAEADGMTITPPYASIEVTSSPSTGDVLPVIALLLMLSAAPIIKKCAG